MTGLRQWAGAIAALLASLGVAAEGAGQQTTGLVTPGEVVGRVVDADGTGLPHAWIRYRAAGGVWSIAQSDDDGHYRLRVPPGNLYLEGNRVGYRAAALEVIVPAGATVRVDLRLEQQPVDLEGILVRTDRLGATAVPPRELRAMTPSPDPQLDLTTMALDGGLAEVAAAVTSAGDAPGEPPGEGAQLLLMRGSSADLKLLLLDGAPVYTPFHLAGLLDGFDGDLLGRTSHFVGAAPTRHDGGLDYILDLQLRAPRDDGRLHLRGHADLLSAGATVEWGLPEGGLLLSGRSLHGGGFSLTGGSGVPYGYTDGLMRGAWRVGGLDLHLTGFANEESVELGQVGAPSLPDRAVWSNRLLSLRARHSTGAIDWRWGVAASRYTAELPLRDESVESYITNPVLAQGATGRVRATVEGVRPVGDEGGVLRFGLATDHTAMAYGSSLSTEAGHRRTDVRTDGRTVGGHLEWSTPLGSAVASRLGLRIDHHNPGGLRGALRGSLAWALTPTAVLTLAGGRYHQFVRSGVSFATEVGSLTAAPGGTTHHLRPGQADHLLVGLDQELTPQFRLGLQGYVKRFSNLAGPDASRRSSGVDLRLLGREGDRTGWLGYSLSWSWAGEAGGAPADGGPEGVQRFMGRHLLTAGFRGPIIGALGLDARVSFSDGLPLTEVPLEMESGSPAFDFPILMSGRSVGTAKAERGAAPPASDGFLRLDVEFHAEWDAPVGEGRIRPYLKVMNALDRRDAFFYYFEPWRNSELTPLARRSILPVVGVAWRF